MIGARSEGGVEGIGNELFQVDGGWELSPLMSDGFGMEPVVEGVEIPLYKAVKTGAAIMQIELVSVVWLCA
jgi:hypothetical protein